MGPFIYLHQGKREQFKRFITVFIKTYMERVSPVFDSIDEEANEYTQKVFEMLGQSFDPDRDDEADFAERAQEQGYEYWEGLALMQYNTKLMSIATLYQFWEQQVRKLVFEELNRHHTFSDKKGRIITFKTFCTRGIDDMKEVFHQCGVELESLNSWAKINELRLLQNVIKHGDGKSSSDLEALRPDFYRKIGNTKIMDLYLSVLNEVALDVDDNEIVVYGDALKEFWDELPERMYFDENL